MGGFAPTFLDAFEGRSGPFGPQHKRFAWTISDAGQDTHFVGRDNLGGVLRRVIRGLSRKAKVPKLDLLITLLKPTLARRTDLKLPLIVAANETSCTCLEHFWPRQLRVTS